MAVSLVALALAGPASVARADPDVVAEWHLDSGSGGITPDASGNGHDGTLSGSATIVGGGRFASALDLDQPNASSVTVPDAPSLDLQKLTVLAWIKGTGPGQYQYAVGKGGNCGEPSSYGFSTGSTSGLTFYVSDGSGPGGLTSPDAGAAVWDGQWHTIAGTYDGSTVRLYVDGVEVGTGTAGSIGPIYYTQANQQLKIGDYGNHNNSSCTYPYTWPGQIDEVRLYNRALGSNEVAYLSRPDFTSPPELPIPGQPPPTTTTGSTPPPPPQQPPVISSVQAPNTVTAGSSAAITAVVDSTAKTLNWDFNGDGKTDASCPGSQPSVAFRMPSVARRRTVTFVTLKATNLSGLSSTQKTQVTVAPPAPKPAGLSSIADQKISTAVARNPVAVCAAKDAFLVKVDPNATLASIFARADKCLSVTVEVPSMRIQGCFLPIAAPTDVPQAERDSVLQLIQTKFGAPPSDAAAAMKLSDGLIATGQVSMNGVRLTPGPGAAIVVEKQLESILSSNAAFNVGGILLNNAKAFRFDTSGATTIPLGDFATLPGGLQGLGGFLLDGDVNITLAGGNGPDAHADVVANLKLPAFLGGFPVKVNARVGADGRFVLDALHAGPANFTIPGLDAGVQNLVIDYRDGVWNGTMKVCLPPPSGLCLAVEPENGILPPGGVSVGPGDDFRIFANLEFPAPGISLTSDVFLNRIGAGLANPPLRFLGGVGLTAAQIFEIDGQLVIAFPSSSDPYKLEQDRASIGNNFPAALYGISRDSFTLAVAADAFMKIPLVGRTKLAGAYLLYQYPGIVNIGGGVDVGFAGVVSIRGSMQGDFDFSKGLFNLFGQARACVADVICEGGTVDISSHGAGGCVDVGPLSVGGGVVYSPFDIILKAPDGCKWSTFREDRLPHIAQAGTTRTVHTTAGDPDRDIEFRGTDGAPRVRVTTPDGTTLESTDGSGVAHNDNIAIVRSESLKLTVVGLIHPQTGDNKIELLDGSPAVDRVREATNPPDAKITAKVTGTGSRRTLTYDIRKRDAQQVTFYETVGKATRQIGTATSGRGHFSFAPVPGKGKSTIVAQFTLVGIPAERLTVASFAPPSPRMPKPRSVHVRHVGTALRVTWAKVPGATRYEVVAKLKVGGQRFVKSANRSAIVRNVPRWSAGTAEVRALAIARDGAPRSARFRANGRRPKTRVGPLPHRKRHHKKH